MSLTTCLHALRVERAQGFLVGRPMPESELVRFISSGLKLRDSTGLPPRFGRRTGKISPVP